MAGAKLSVADTTYLSDVLGHLGLSAPQAHQLLEKQTGCFFSCPVSSGITGTHCCLFKKRSHGVQPNKTE